MGKNSKIEWCHHTVNFWWGCEKVSPACTHCYAELLAKLFSRGKATWGKTGARWIRYNAFGEALKLEGVSKKAGGGQRIFVNSMSDTFEDNPLLENQCGAMLLYLKGLPVANWLLLTKRPENVMRMMPEIWRTNWPAHIWIGTTVENQEMADKRIPELLKIPAKVRFLSCEPLLGPLDLSSFLSPLHWEYQVSEDECEHRSDCPCGGTGQMPLEIHWVICGGESGHHARPMNPSWAFSLRDQCNAADVPFFFKQVGEWVSSADPAYGKVKGKIAHIRSDGSFWDNPPQDEDADALTVVKVGKKAAGRELGGREWNEFPL